ncbi:ABC transporter ATP-binding protein [Rossellomorea marisflavi]|uniref:ABC transporter ATP-binding protein n=1 Tax=Rossellomorea marisflavi TaxID=189381 RepID=UPI00064F6187|nr:ABC transporter ATP-binding protein [Rossellomorea marisflavi]KML01115.1 spermidine/putrescine ABC transporter ATP-binding protein [Rossellomorea marisflavi]
MASIQIDSVQKTFGKVTAVDHLDLAIKDGEFFTFLGPSGCGKTTTLRMIAGFYYPTKGVVRFGDKDMTRVPPEKRNTGMVFQNYALFPHMTVFENVAFGLRVRKLNIKEVKARVKNVLEKVRLDQYAERQVSQLSGGQQQRVALARALVIEPEILLLDEPLSNLDAKLRDEMRSEILRLQKEYNITTIYVTHDQAEALSMSDRIAVFNYGVCHQVGTPAEIYNEPANDFVASFIGEINLLPAAIEEREGVMAYATVLSGALPRPIAVRGNNIITAGAAGQGTALSIRPEAINLVDSSRSADENVFPGVIKEIHFFGSVINVMVEADNQLIRVHTLNGEGSRSLHAGSPVFIELPKEHIRVIPMVSGDPS